MHPPKYFPGERQLYHLPLAKSRANPRGWCTRRNIWPGTATVSPTAGIESANPRGWCTRRNICPGTATVSPTAGIESGKPRGWRTRRNICPGTGSVSITSGVETGGPHGCCTRWIICPGTAILSLALAKSWRLERYGQPSEELYQVPSITKYKKLFITFRQSSQGLVLPVNAWLGLLLEPCIRQKCKPATPPPASPPPPRPGTLNCFPQNIKIPNWETHNRPRN